MSETISSLTLPPHEDSHPKLCNVCGRATDGLIPFVELPDDLKPIVVGNAPGEGKIEDVCQHCVELFSRAKSQLDSHARIFEQTSYVLPTPLRLEADERFTGRDVTIAFLDSGFYAHADLTKPHSRIVAYHNIFAPADDLSALETADVASWHGMMTSVVAAGNGYLSDGFYLCFSQDSDVLRVIIGYPAQRL